MTQAVINKKIEEMEGLADQIKKIAKGLRTELPHVDAVALPKGTSKKKFIKDALMKRNISRNRISNKN